MVRLHYAFGRDDATGDLCVGKHKFLEARVFGLLTLITAGCNMTSHGGHAALCGEDQWLGVSKDKSARGNNQPGRLGPRIREGVGWDG